LEERTAKAALQKLKLKGEANSKALSTSYVFFGGCLPNQNSTAAYCYLAVTQFTRRFLGLT